MTTPPTSSTREPELSRQLLDDALAPRHLPKRPSALGNSLVFGRRALLKLRHVPEHLIDVTVLPAILTLSVTYLFGGAIAGSPRQYVQFLLPGILVQTMLFATYQSGSTLNDDLSRGVYDRFRSMPVWTPAPLVGTLLGDQVRYGLDAVVVLGLGLSIGFRPDGGPLGVVAGVLLAMLFASGVSWAFTYLGLVLRSPAAVMNAGFTVMFPLTLASNVLVPPSTMPGWLQTIVDHNPITRAVTAVRGLMYGDVTFEQIAWVLGATLVITLLFLPLVVRRLRALT